MKRGISSVAFAGLDLRQYLRTRILRSIDLMRGKRMNIRLSLSLDHRASWGGRLQ